MPDEDPSVLGNLPRSRPGRRSDKRTAASKPRQPTQARAQRAATKAKAKRSAAPRPAASKPRARTTASSASRKPRPAQPSPSDPVTGAMRLAGQVAGAGFKVAGAVLKRLPRP
ncbi:MAG: hypothetical protein ACJ77M_08050 [Thermoleophilaceae bacterium]